MQPQIKCPGSVPTISAEAAHLPSLSPQIENGTLHPDEDKDPAPGASLEEEEEEEHEQERGRQDKKKLPIKPQLIPSGSGEPGVLMGPDTQGGLYHTHKLLKSLNSS